MSVMTSQEENGLLKGIQLGLGCNLPADEKLLCSLIFLVSCNYKQLFKEEIK